MPTLWERYYAFADDTHEAIDSLSQQFIDPVVDQRRRILRGSPKAIAAAAGAVVVSLFLALGGLLGAGVAIVGLYTKSLSVVGVAGVFAGGCFVGLVRIPAGLNRVRSRILRDSDPDWMRRTEKAEWARKRIEKLREDLIIRYPTYPPDWKVRRWQVLNRDGHRCTACKARRWLHVHHCVPIAMGGTHDLQNLATLCRSCHEKEHGVEPGTFGGPWRGARRPPPRPQPRNG